MRKGEIDQLLEPGLREIPDPGGVALGLGRLGCSVLTSGNPTLASRGYTTKNGGRQKNLAECPDHEQVVVTMQQKQGTSPSSQQDARIGCNRKKKQQRQCHRCCAQKGVRPRGSEPPQDHWCCVASHEREDDASEVIRERVEEIVIALPARVVAKIRQRHAAPVEAWHRSVSVKVYRTCSPEEVDYDRPVQQPQQTPVKSSQHPAPRNWTPSAAVWFRMRAVAIALAGLPKDVRYPIAAPAARQERHSEFRSVHCRVEGRYIVRARSPGPPVPG
jgi:hypothetical protein